MLLLPGSPTTLLVPSDGGYYIIDPGSDHRRAEILASVRVKGVLITHCHSDHVLAAALMKDLGEEVYAPRIESCSIENPDLRSFTTFGGIPPKSVLLFEVKGVRVDHPFEPPAEVGPLEAIPLPGHTYGQVGYKGKNFLYAADSIFGDKLLRKVVIPYYQDHRKALETLYSLRERCREFKKVILSHGPVVEGRRVEELIDLNINHLKKIEAAVLDLLRRELTVEEIAFRIIQENDGEPTPGSVLLGAITVRSILSYLHAEGKAEPKSSPRGVIWSAP